jgi:glycosyltransferase involved in cell wall biosynthesis
MRIGVITWPLGEQKKGLKIARSLLYKYLKILEPISSETQVISQNLSLSEFSWHPNTVHITNIKAFSHSSNSFIRIINYIIYQFAVCLKLIKISNKIDVVFMYGGSSLLLPNIIAHIMRKKVFIFAQGPDSKVTKLSYPSRIGGILSSINKSANDLNWSLADRIIVETKSEVEYEGMHGLGNKILATGALFVDNTQFNSRNIYRARRKLVGYVGSLGAAKGVMEFVGAIPIISKEDTEIQFLIGGDGSLLDEIKATVFTFECKEKVKITGWISDEDLPIYLSDLRLLVLPSYTEGLPTIILEAMACGTPVLVTPVGGIPDIIKDGETGFILENNSSESIAKNVLRAINYPGIDMVIKNASSLFELNFTYAAAVERYKRILLCSQ